MNFSACDRQGIGEDRCSDCPYARQGDSGLVSLMNPYNTDVSNYVLHGDSELGRRVLETVARIRDDAMRQRLTNALENGVQDPEEALQLAAALRICPRAEVTKQDLHRIQRVLQQGQLA